jgi:hypothetical protein
MRGLAMRMPPVRFRLRLREFLLLVMLASIVAAYFAMRARTADLKVAEVYAAHAHRARVEAKDLAGQIEFDRWRLEMAPTLSADWAAGCDLRLMPAVIKEPDILAEGENLVVVTEFGDDSLWFRVFDGAGRRVVDHVEAYHPGFMAFKQRLARLRPPHELTRTEKAQVIAAVATFVNDYRETLQAGIKKGQVVHSEMLAEAERLERLSRRP